MELFWPAFYRIRTEYGEIVSFDIQCECGKMRTRITTNTDTFYAAMTRGEIYTAVATLSVKPNLRGVGG